MLCQMGRRRKKLITHGDTMKVKELKDFVEDKTIHWDMTPQSAREGVDGVEIISKEELEELNKKIEERIGVYFYVDVWNMNARLGIFENKKHGGTSRVIENFDNLEISEDMLEGCIHDVGGALNISGHYPINEKVKEKLKDHLVED